jgi:hypothetical protein
MALLTESGADLFNRACFNYPTLGDLSTSKSWKEAGTKSAPFEKSSHAGRTTD